MLLIVSSTHSQKIVKIDEKRLNKHAAKHAAAVAKFTGYVTVTHEKTGETITLNAR